MKGTSKTKMGLSRFLGGSSLNGDVEILQWFIITFPNLQVLGAHMIIIDHITSKIEPAQLVMCWSCESPPMASACIRLSFRRLCASGRAADRLSPSKHWFPDVSMIIWLNHVEPPYVWSKTCGFLYKIGLSIVDVATLRR